jgi:hypothetical protein
VLRQGKTHRHRHHADGIIPTSPAPCPPRARPPPPHPAAATPAIGIITGSRPPRPASTGQQALGSDHPRSAELADLARQDLPRSIPKSTSHAELSALRVVHAYALTSMFTRYLNGCPWFAKISGLALSCILRGLPTMRLTTPRGGRIGTPLGVSLCITAQ